MCGIFAILNPSHEMNVIDSFMKGSHRGPDQTETMDVDSVWLGFHRLAINGISGTQPFCIHGIYLVCNGEVYNYKELLTELSVQPQTSSDCEVILHLYEKYGIEQTLHMINASEFAFVLYDSNTKMMYSARDPYGVRPLFKGICGESVCYASEMKMFPTGFAIQPVIPGTWSDGITTTHYCSLPSIHYGINPYQLVRNTLYDCVKKRVVNTDRPIACLLSGGLDSSLIASIVNECRKELAIAEPLETYSIGLEGSVDLYYASIMATYLGSKHTSIVMRETEFLESIPEVIYALESRDTTTVRASVGNFLVAKYIKENSSAKVIFNGDGADEVCGGYLYLNMAPSTIEFDKECRRLVKDIHYFDALRSDRCISYHGLEARTPFLDRAFVETYLSIPVEFRRTRMEKELLRETFSDILPTEIRYRKKEAFSDGVSSLNNSWYSIIQTHISTFFEQEYRDSGTDLTMEQYYYKRIFDNYYCDWVPYFWMPKYTTTKECSARALENYGIPPPCKLERCVNTL